MLKLTLLAVLALFAIAAHAERKTQNYDSHGNFAGTARTHGNATTFTDKNGRFVVSAINRGNGMALYDQHDHFTSSVVQPAPQR